MNEVLQNMLTRRSVRAFADTPVESEKLKTILQAATYAPSGMGKQSWHFTVVQKKEQIQKLAAVMAEALQKPEYDLYRPACMILVSGEKENGNHLADTGCAMENIMLMAHALGLGSCWVNQLKELSDVPAVRAVLDGFGVPQDHGVYAIAVLGYPAGDLPQPKPRREGVVHYA